VLFIIMGKSFNAVDQCRGPPTVTGR